MAVEHETVDAEPMKYCNPFWTTVEATKAGGYWKNIEGEWMRQEKVLKSQPGGQWTPLHAWRELEMGERMYGGHNTMAFYLVLAHVQEGYHVEIFSPRSDGGAIVRPIKGMYRLDSQLCKTPDQNGGLGYVLAFADGIKLQKDGRTMTLDKDYDNPDKYPDTWKRTQ